MKIREALQNITTIRIPQNPLPVEKTSAAALLPFCAANAEISEQNDVSAKAGIFSLAVAGKNRDIPGEISKNAPGETQWAYFAIDEKGVAQLIVSHPALLYSYVTRITEDWLDLPVADFQRKKYHATAFRWHRPLYDYLLTQTWRTARHFDAEEHIRELARAGYTHVEVNGLAMPVPFEEAVPGEFYSQFYSYCIALDQYVYSEINKGIYPVDYLTANLTLLKKYAALGRKYGLEPGILCFEPRTVPERFFQKYPTLRGARVDHPYRSRLPRYTITTAHPLGRQHYREMMQKLLRQVPDLAYMSIWSNDSGSGFEYTSSLYVGRNGGPYLIREWRTHEQIAEVAGKNVVDYMKILRDAAAEINPDFRVSLRLEPFKVEHDFIMANLEERLDIEVPSLLVRGYDLPYRHDKYNDIVGIAGTVQHTQLEKEEKKLIEKNQKRGIGSHLIYSHGNGYNFEPLIGLPYPWLLYEKLQAMVDRGVEYAANLGGFMPSRLASYNINQEVFRRFMLEPNTDTDELIKVKAAEWVGEDPAGKLVEIWQTAEEAVRWLPPLYLYSGFGFVWMRIWVRPIIPDLHAVPEQDRRYYEDYMVTSAHNTNLTDLGRDVLFQLITREYGASYAERVDKNVIGRIEKAIELASQMAGDKSLPEDAAKVFADQRDRLRGLRCWVGVQRNVAAWVNGVYSYLAAQNQKEKDKWRGYLVDMVANEIQNTKNLLELWESSEVDFMVVSRTGETSYIYGENFGELLRRKIGLMEKYGDVEPRIDREIMWKV